jgi:hypothetical protein
MIDGPISRGITLSHLLCRTAPEIPPGPFACWVSPPRPMRNGALAALCAALDKNPSCASITARNTSSCANRAARIDSASDSHRRVDPSISVNKNVTTPEGGSPADTCTGCHTKPCSTRQSRLTFETLVTRLFRDGIQFCSGLVDLVVGVGHHLGGGHRFTLSGERLVGRFTEHIAEVSNRGAELCHDGKCSERA